MFLQLAEGHLMGQVIISGRLKQVCGRSNMAETTPILDVQEGLPFFIFSRYIKMDQNSWTYSTS